MKSIFLKTLVIFNFLLLYNCKAQTITTSDYIVFYNDVAPKLNTMVPTKTQFYGQNFSNFYNELQNKNIDVILINYDTKMDPGTKYYILRLYFANINMWTISTDNSYQFPSIAITFQDEIPPQIKSMIEQSGSQWTYNMIQFFANMKIEKIKFIGLNGYNSSDRSVK
jgi:hypothetical protein